MLIPVFAQLKHINQVSGTRPGDFILIKGELYYELKKTYKQKL